MAGKMVFIIMKKNFLKDKMLRYVPVHRINVDIKCVQAYYNIHVGSQQNYNFTPAKYLLAIWCLITCMHHLHECS